MERRHPHLTLMKEEAQQRQRELCELYNALRWLACAGEPWCWLPTNVPPWGTVSWLTQRSLRASCSEAMTDDLRSIIRVARERRRQPNAMVLDGRALQSTCESGPRARYDDCKRKHGSKVHMAVDTLRHLLAILITPANEQEHA